MCSVPQSPIDWLVPGLGLGGNKTPSPPQLPPLPQGAKMPYTSPLTKRNTNGGGPATPAGSTLLTGPSGIAQSSLLIGSSSLLGGGKPGG